MSLPCARSQAQLVQDMRMRMSATCQAAVPESKGCVVLKQDVAGYLLCHNFVKDGGLLLAAVQHCQLPAQR